LGISIRAHPSVPLGHCRQPFDETLLPGMPLADLVKPAAEFGQRAPRLGNGAQIEQKGGYRLSLGPNRRLMRQ
jgi:hypothetical protein